MALAAPNRALDFDLSLTTAVLPSYADEDAGHPPLCTPPYPLGGLRTCGHLDDRHGERATTYAVVWNCSAAVLLPRVPDRAKVLGESPLMSPARHYRDVG